MDAEDSGAHRRPVTWREEHGASILGGVLALLFIVVLVSQMVC